MKELYNDYLIIPVYNFTLKETEFEVYPDKGNEPGYCFHSTTLEKVKAWIDSKVECEIKKPKEHE